MPIFIHDISQPLPRGYHEKEAAADYVHRNSAGRGVAAIAILKGKGGKPEEAPESETATEEPQP